MFILTKLLLHQLLLLFVLFVRSSTGCPKMCTCKWKGGKEWVECTSRGLKELPQGAREETQVLDLSDNQLFSLAADSFFALRLTNLQRLYLGHSCIRQIAARAFTGLQGLVELDLSENELENVPLETFSSITNLMRLNLASNPIRVLYRDTFRDLGQLNYLDLSNCQLTKIDTGAFAGLHTLEWLRLNDNLLQNIPKATLPLTTNLHGLPLSGNPWLCDCHLVTLYDWLKASQNQAHQETEPTCSKPVRLYTKTIRTLKRQDLACAPNILLTDHLEVYKGENVTVYCNIKATPPPITSWLINGEIFHLEDNLVKNERLRLSYNHHNSVDAITINLEILDAQEIDEGIYICQAENAAGIFWKNLSLRILDQEQSTFKPPVETAGTGHAATIAAGALLGTLLALSCLFLGIYLYAHRLHSHSKKQLKQISCNSLVPPSILKKNDQCDKVRYKFNDNSNSNIRVSQDTVISTEVGNTYLGNVKLKAKECSEMTYSLNQHQTQLRLLEPDLINEVPVENSCSVINDLRDEQVYSSLYSSCLDRDGYPLNFGLPKLDKVATNLNNENTCTSLSQVCQRNLYPINQSTALSVMRFPYNAKLISNETFIDSIYPVPEIGFTPVIRKPFVPSPPASYCNEPTTLSPRSFISDTSLKSINVAETLAHINSPSNSLQPQIGILENYESIGQSESPDEGYVGDAMDV